MTKLIPLDAAIAAAKSLFRLHTTGLYGAAGVQQYGLLTETAEATIRAVPAIDPAAIREVALRDAANLVESHRKQALDKMPSPYLMSRNDAKWVQANSDVMKILSTSILALIGEKK